MTNIKDALISIETYLKGKNIPILNKLKPGLPYLNITLTLKKIGIDDPDLIQLFSWHDGVPDLQNNLVTDLELFPEGILLSLEDALRYYEVYTKVEKIWSSSLFPIFTNGGGDFYLLKFENEYKGYIYLYAPSLILSEKPVPIFHSLNTLIHSVSNCFLNGAFTFNFQLKEYEVDYDLRREIYRKYNPDIRYWVDLS